MLWANMWVSATHFCYSQEAGAHEVEGEVVSVFSQEAGAQEVEGEVWGLFISAQARLSTTNM